MRGFFVCEGLIGTRGGVERSSTGLKRDLEAFTESLEISAEKLYKHVDGFGGPRGLLRDAPVTPVVAIQWQHSKQGIRR